LRKWDDFVAVDFTYCLVGTGWAEATLSDGSHIATTTAPYLLDPSLLALLQCALGAAGEADIRWSSE
jgi:hypothetical protein